MKRVVPAIIILISLSVIGIFYTQVQWIRSAMQIKQEQYQRSLQSAIRNIQVQIQEDFLAREPSLEFLTSMELRQQALIRYFTIEAFPRDYVARTLSRNLSENGINDRFEFAVINVFGFPVMASDGFDSTMVARSYTAPLVPNLYLNYDEGPASQVLCLYLAPPNMYKGRMGLVVFTSGLLLLIVIAAFWLIIRTLINQRKLTEVKSDFMNNMTHEFKTPLATIALAADALANKKVIGDAEKILYYSNMIKEENKRMNKQVETILQTARLEKNEMQLDLIPLDAHEVIQKVADTLALRIADKGGELKLALKAERTVIIADEVHFSNIIFNLIDNAIKYSREEVAPALEIDTRSGGNALVIRIRDNGIGMSKETVNRIFEKFYRAHTGNLHNVKGFGLGLSYVKTMMDAHKGKIKVDSHLGKGSLFVLSFPLASGYE